jgi:pimeloyl-ACP methyl ester carboxylesterase
LATNVEQNEIFAHSKLIIMKKITVYAATALLILSSHANAKQSARDSHYINEAPNDTLLTQNGYSEVNGIHMYYEIYGEGKPLVLLHGGGSTIQTTYGRVIPMLATHRRIIAVELQAHGRTSDRKKDLTFEQDADDVAVLLKNLNIDKADFFGFSNGGTTVVQIAIRHPEIVDKIIVASAMCKRDGAPPQFWDFMNHARLDNMPQLLKEAYKQVAPDPNGLQNMHDKDVKRMVNFKDIPNEKLTAIKAQTLIIIGDKDVVTPEHAVEMHRLITNSELAIIPGGHGDYIGEITTLKPQYKNTDFEIPLIENFLESKQSGEKKLFD